MIRDGPTIAALLTPLAPGAIAVVAVAGPRTDEILSAILRKPRNEEPFAPAVARPSYCRIIDGDSILDDAVAVRLEGPRAELCTHGGVRIAQRLLHLLEARGAAVVSAQEFNDTVTPIHPIERDVDAALLRSPSRRLTQWLLSQRSILPAYMDCRAALSSAEREAFVARSRVAIRLLDGLFIALIGPPNAGKSTLANRLIGRDRIITSDVPGTTRDWVAETALIEGWPVTLTDTAGIRETDCTIETEAIRRGREQARRADLILIVLDATRSAAEQSACLQQLTGMLPMGLPQVVILNKCDLAASPLEREGGKSLGAIESAVRISALGGLGLTALESQIVAQFRLEKLDNVLPTGFLASHIG